MDITSLPSPPALIEAPIVAHYVRGGFVESVHRASVAVTDATGRVTLARGAIDDPILPRSSNKPLQALAMLRSGLDLAPPLLALACASHSGEPMHLAGARQILADAGLCEADLQNTPDRPHAQIEAEAWIAAGRGPESVAQNCSGKHAAMLATCVVNAWDTATYRDPAHPLQQAMKAAIEQMSAETVTATVVDGCGAPAMALTLKGLARAFGALAAAPADSFEGRVAAAMSAHPHMVGGTGRDVTALMAAHPGLIAKDGAESVYAVGLPDGRGVAVKVVDGAQRAKGVVLGAVLAGLGVQPPPELTDRPVLGHGEPVGAIVPVNL